MADGKPIFRIDELIEALLKGSPADPVYLQVGSKKYGIDKIETGVIRVKSGKKTQTAETVVQTLRRFATGAPKEEETGVAWRIVGVGGGTAIRSVRHEGGKIIVRTLANEGKGRAAESFGAESNGDQVKLFYEGIYYNDDEEDKREGQEIKSYSLVSKQDYLNYYEDTKDNPCECDEQGCLSCFLDEASHTPALKKGGISSYESLWFEDDELNALDAESLGDTPTYTPEAYDPLTESPTDYDPKAKTFSASSKTKSKRRKKSDKRRAATPAKRAWNTKVSTKISTIMAEYDKTGKIGNSRPKNKASAMKQAIAVAYSISAREYKTSGKRLPAGIRNAEGEQSPHFR